MRALIEMTDGLATLQSIMSERPEESVYWNEAQNRYQFIDRLLSECLGWQKPDIRVEHADDDGGRADYVLGQPAKAVLEAKKESLTWKTVPTGTPNTLRKLKPLLVACKNFSKAVNQVIPYCSLKGAPVAIVCNGPQLAIFQAITIGQEPLEGECYLFDGFKSYVENFALLWTLLSPEGITENRAFRQLSLHRNPRIPSKASQSIAEPNKHRYRDNLQDELRQIGSLLLEEIEDNPDLRTEFFKECYVPIEANNRHLLLSKQIIESRYKRISGDGVKPASLDSATRTASLSDQFLMNAGSKPIVVIGDVGVGKSSFFENLYLNINDKEKSKTIFININLGSKANLSDDLKVFVIDNIISSLRHDYGIDIESQEFVSSIYHNELKIFDKSIDGQWKEIDDLKYQKEKITFLKDKVKKRDSHLHASLAHISHGRKQKVILILDNADQRTFEVQQQAFLIAQELAATRNLFVFIALRPSSFYLSKTTGTLAAYQNKILTISPPPADEVIKKRITFALRVAEGKAAPAALEGIRLNLQSIAHFLRATLRSVRQNDQIRQFLSNITGGNTRSVIELITTFCGSPNVDARKIVGIEGDSSRSDYVVPIHEFTKHALLGEFSYYNPQSSFVACNLFDVSLPDPREHFLASLVVSFLASNIGVRDNDGFVSGNHIVEQMSRHGFIDIQTNECLKRIAAKKLIETPYSHYREIVVPDTESPQSFYYRASSVGVYHAKYWLGSFSFLDAMSTDTPIFDESVRARVCELASSFEIADRREKTEIFKDYLESKWHLANFDSPYFDFPTIVASKSDSFKVVASVVKRLQMSAGKR